MNKKTGTLYICSTPIGNLEDITIRAIKVLRKCDLIAAEDTRRTKKLLNYFDIDTPLTSYYSYNEHKKGRGLIKKLGEGLDIALVSDAGTPGICDPGAKLIKAAIQYGIDIVPLPGASAVITALSVSGMPTNKFIFEGFLASIKQKRRRRLQELADEERAVVFYESPHRLLDVLLDMYDILGDRNIAVIRELTKIHEEVKRDVLSEVIEHFKRERPKGEFTLVLAGAKEKKETLDTTVNDEEIIVKAEELVSKGMSVKDAVKQIASSLGISKRKVYNIVNKAGE